MHIKRKDIKEKFTTIFLAVLFFSGSVSMIEDYNFLRLPLFVISLGILIFGVFFVRKLVFTNNYWIFYIVIVLFMLSSLLHGDSGLFLSAGQILLVFISLSQIVPTLLEEKSSLYIIIAILISHLPLLIIPIVTEGIDTIPYQGLFYNTNSFGNIVATLYSIFLAIFVRYLRSNKNGRKKVIPLSITSFLLLACFIGVIYSASRNSFLTILIVSIATLIIYLYKYKISFKRIKNSYIFSFVLMILITLLFSYEKTKEAFDQNIIGKFERKSSDLFDDRSDLWIETLKEISFIGQGSSYFDKFIISPHNTFITLIGYFGVSGIILLLFFIIVLYQSVKYILSNQDDKYNFLPMLMILTFLSLSVAEVMLMKISMLATFAGIGIISRNKNMKYQ